MAGWWMYSVYLAPSMSLAEFGDAVDRLATDARGHTPSLIAGDFNAWAVEWGSSLTNARGRTLLEDFSTLDVTLLNTGAQPTFSRAGASSVVDLTFVSCSRASQCTWVLSDAYTESDHAAVLTALNTRRAQPTPLPPPPSPARRGYKTDTMDIQSFAEHMQRLEANGCAEQMAESAINQLQVACDNCMTAKRVHPRHRDSVYWWNHGIAAARTECIKASIGLPRQLAVKYNVEIIQMVKPTAGPASLSKNASNTTSTKGLQQITCKLRSLQ
ncbi:uncharacterized protein [Drosophila kikkawai]|uniref:Endonuclease/exonuclease/phosphatase domain-containing protein n=1 Tax=Drosophila kikkawai TaxID=30033 RepID=A0ABM4GHU8_DROKI